MKLPLLIAALGLLAANTGHAAVSLALGDSFGDPSSVSINPGESFTVTLTLSSTAEFTTGISYFLAANGIGNGGFRITGLDVTGSDFSDLVTGTGVSLSPANSLLSPTNTFDLGALVAGEAKGVGDYLVATLILQALPGVIPRSYTIGTDSAFVLNEAFDSISTNQPTYTVNIVPEAQTAVLLSIVALGGLVRRRK